MVTVQRADGAAVVGRRSAQTLVEEGSQVGRVGVEDQGPDECCTLVTTTNSVSYELIEPEVALTSHVAEMVGRLNCVPPAIWVPTFSDVSI